MKTAAMFISIDFETTGDQPDDEVIEVGWTTMDVDDFRIEKPQSSLVRCDREIKIEAQAVHKIIPEDLVGKPTLAQVLDQIHTDTSGCDIILAAHRAEFEQSFMPLTWEPNAAWICTWKCAMRIWPDAPTFSNQGLRFYLGHKMSEGQRKYADREHRAGPDAYVTCWTLRSLLNAGADFEQLIKWSREPALLPRLTFGKHKGSKWTQVPPDYLDWIVSPKCDMDDDVKWNARITLSGEREQMAREAAFATEDDSYDPKRTSETPAPDQ